MAFSEDRSSENRAMITCKQVIQVMLALCTHPHIQLCLQTWADVTDVIGLRSRRAY